MLLSLSMRRITSLKCHSSGSDPFPSPGCSTRQPHPHPNLLPGQASVMRLFVRCAELGLGTVLADRATLFRPKLILATTLCHCRV